MSLDAQWAQRWIELSASAVAEHRDYLVDLDEQVFGAPRAAHDGFAV